MLSIEAVRAASRDVGVGRPREALMGLIIRDARQTYMHAWRLAVIRCSTAEQPHSLGQASGCWACGARLRGDGTPMLVLPVQAVLAKAHVKAAFKAPFLPLGWRSLVSPNEDPRPGPRLQQVLDHMDHDQALSPGPHE